MITPQSRFFLRLYGHYRHQVLVHAGGLFDQPNVYIQAMEILDENINDGG